MRRSIAVDVDLTIVDSLTPWIKWWSLRTGKSFNWSEVSKEYSINKQLESAMTREETLEFWKNPALYDGLSPLVGSRNALRLLKSTGHNVFFVSNCEDAHFDSKKRFLDKFFPFHDGLINTHRKHEIEADIYFDDHVDYVDKIIANRPHSKVYQFVTKDNEYQLNSEATPLHCWTDFVNLHFGKEYEL